MISLDQLQDNWAIVCGFVAGIVAWGKTQQSIKYQDENQSKSDARIGKIESEIGSIKESAASMAASAEATRESVQLLLERQLK